MCWCTSTKRQVGGWVVGGWGHGSMECAGVQFDSRELVHKHAKVCVGVWVWVCGWGTWH